MQSLSSVHPARPTTSMRAAPRAVKSASLEEGEAVLVVPRDGGYTATRKVACVAPDRVLAVPSPSGEALQYVPTDGGTLTCLDASGAARWRAALPSGQAVGSLHADPSRNRILVKTGTDLIALDADSGRQVARLHLDKTDYSRQVAVRLGGQVVLTDENGLVSLDDDLQPHGSPRPLGMRPRELRELQDGSLLLLEDACPAHAMVLGLDGRTRLEEHHLGLYSTVTDARGNLWMIDDHDFSKRQRDVLKYTPGHVGPQRFSAPTDAETVIPRRDGSYLVFSDRLTEPGIVVYGADGRQTARHEFPQNGHLRRFLLTRDEQTAYAVLDHYHDKAPTQRTLYRLDLGASAGLRGWMPFLDGISAAPVYTSTGEKGSFVPAVLDDGRIAVFKEAGAEMLDAQGHCIKRYDTPQQLLADAPQAEVITRSIRLGIHGDPDVPGTLQTLVDRMTQKPPVAAGDDGCLDFPQGDVDPNLPVLHLDERALLDRSLLDFTFHDNVELPFPGGGVARIEQQAITFDTDKGARTFRLEGAARYTAACAVQAGGRPAVAAGTSEGLVHWYDGKSQGPAASYAMGAPVMRLEVIDDVLRATSVDGRMLLLRPDSSLQAVAAQAQPQSAAGTVVMEPERVVIGGIAVKRNAG